MNRPNRVRDRFISDLYKWLTPELLYHCFTGENDPEELERIGKLDHALQASLLEKAEHLWPERLQKIADARRKEKRESKEAVQQFVLKTSK
jgi:hypothetical protein